MARSWLTILLLMGAPAWSGTQGQSTPQQQPKAPENQQKNSTQSGAAEEEPPEEDESLAPEKYVLNPLESDRNVRVGNYYWHKSNYKAAAKRYERATHFNPNSQEAFYKLGEAEEKLKNGDAARSAFQKVVQLAPDSKLAHEARKKLGKT